MKPTTNRFTLLSLLLFAAFTAYAQQPAHMDDSPQNTVMKTDVVEREIPDAGRLTPEQLKAISQKSCSVLQVMGPRIQWLHSYVTGNKIYCIYKAENEEWIRKHAQDGGFPVNTIVQVAAIISPATSK